MIMEYRFEIIAVAMAVFSLALYFLMRSSSGSRDETILHHNKDVKPPQKTEQITETKEEKIVSADHVGSDSTKRRKSDKILPKRPLPDIGTVTKQSFYEFAGERILVAEDNPINQKVIRGLLAETGIELVMADDGQEAVEILEQDTNFLMILMDAHMPRLDGFEATRMIRSNPKYDHILIVALSGDTATDDIQKMKNAGMDEQLAKPLRMDALYKIIYTYANKEAMEDETASSIISVKSLDTSKGVDTCGGDEAFYREILTEFIADYGDSSDRLGGFLRSKNFHSADALLLDIIGVSENIGAHALSASASNIKSALIDVDEQSYLSLFDQYRVNLEHLRQAIKEYMDRTNH